MSSRVWYRKWPSGSCARRSTESAISREGRGAPPKLVGMSDPSSQHPINLPEKPALEGLEQKWNERWSAGGTYAFDRTRSRGEIYSIDTPPPTVSGSLHVGHVFSYTHTDIIARFQ